MLKNAKIASVACHEVVPTEISWNKKLSSILKLTHFYIDLKMNKKLV